MQTRNLTDVKRVIATATVAIGALTAGSALAAAPPSNDNFANAITLAPVTGQTTGTNVDAALEPGEPTHGPSGTYDRSVWYRVTPPASGPVTLDVCATNAPTAIDVYTGSAVDALSAISGQNTECTPFRRPTARRGGAPGTVFTFSGVAGTSYAIAVTSNSAGSPFALKYQVPVAGGGGDTTAPDTTITKAPKKKTKRKKAKFEFTSTESNSTFLCSLNGGEFESCASPHKVKGKKGRNTFVVEAVDAAGNVDGTPATYRWKVKKKKKKT